MANANSEVSTQKQGRQGMSSEGKVRLAEFLTAVKRFEEAVQSGRVVHPSIQQSNGTKNK